MIIYNLETEISVSTANTLKNSEIKNDGTSKMMKHQIRKTTNIIINYK